ncbi:MAG: hypothetical protein FWF63_00800 [Fibromonadales bacterium]|nr:hypothetical protein [Fibromonadales bacterium]
MIKTIISNNPDEANLRQILEAMKGKIGKDDSGHIFFMGMDLTDLKNEVEKLKGGSE